jgi:MHS family proline/betaine transporter-like MFS transporter
MFKKPIMVALTCSVLEWYDFALYGHLTFIMGKLFFPSNQQSQMIAAFSLIGVSYLARPIGGVIFGIIGDKLGRSKTINLSILLMYIPTACIGLLPTYQQSGIIAPILLSLIRLMQGLSMGGMNGVFIYIIEHADNDKKKFYGSLSFLTTCIGIALGSLIIAAISNILSAKDFENWGWRIPFLLSIFIGCYGYFMRKYLSETQVYLNEKPNLNPLKEVLYKHKIKVIRALGINLSMAVPFFILMIFINNFMQNQLHFSHRLALSINFINIAIISLTIFIISSFANKINNNKIMLLICLIMMVFIKPIMFNINNSNIIISALNQFIFAILIGVYSSLIYNYLIEIFPVAIRYTGLGLAMNLGACIFGSFVPLIGSWVLKYYGADHAINFLVYYIMCCNLISIICLIKRDKKLFKF